MPWTLVRPPQLTDARTEGYRSARAGNVSGGFRITWADLAAALLDVGGDPTAVHAVASVAG